MIYMQIDIRIIKFDFSTIYITYLWLYSLKIIIFPGNVFFPPGEFIIIEERENCRIAKRVIVSVKKSIERVFSDLPMVFADR